MNRSTKSILKPSIYFQFFSGRNQIFSTVFPAIKHRVSIRNISDYSPFGVELQGRTVSSDEYRYGYQGQEMDDEVKGEGNSVNYKYRMHDPRVGRFFAVDPLSSKYPHNGSYNFSENRVIDGLELEGLETFIFHDGHGNFNEVHMAAANDFAIQNKAKELHSMYVGYYTDTEHYFSPAGEPTTLKEIKNNHQALPDDYPTMKPSTGKEIDLDLKIEQVKAQNLLQNSAMRDFGVIGQGLTKGPEAALLVFGPEFILGKVAQYYAKFTEGTAIVSDYVNLFKPLSEYDPLITIYRGTTGSEGAGSILFATEDASVAASYINNGGQVVQYELSTSSIKALESTGNLSYKTGINSVTNQVTKEYMFEGEVLKESLKTIAKPVPKL